MGDNCISIVPKDVDSSEVKILAERIFKWLTGNKIVNDVESDCVLNLKGFLPGSNYKYAVEDSDIQLLNLVNNGVEIITERQVWQGVGIDKVSCASCNFDITESDWMDLVEKWFYGVESCEMTCPSCNSIAPITDFNFEPVWAFAELGISFWNWPPLKKEFIDEVEEVINKKVKIVYGRI